MYDREVRSGKSRRKARNRCRCFFLHFSASLFPFFLISVPFYIFPVRDFISHFSCPRFHFAFLLHIGRILRSQLLERGGTGAITLPFR